jgi:hypothetical protein
MKLFLKILGAITLAGTPTMANAVFIDFDLHAATDLLGGTPPDSAVVTDDYSSSGIIFGKAGVSGGVAVVDNPNTFSLPKGACGLDVNGNLMSYCSGDIYFNFVDPGDSSKPAVTDAVDFYIGDGGGDVDPWTINVFDIAGGLIASLDVASQFNTNVAFNYAGMHSFAILDTSGDTAGYFLDSLGFNTPTAATAVSEPATLSLMAIGLAGIGFARRKKA